MQIETDLKLDFKDVLFKPKRSALASRSEVSLERSFRTKWSQRTITCCGLIAANMDTTGTFAMARVLTANKQLVALHKHYTSAEIAEFFLKHPECLPYCFISTGTGAKDAAKLDDTLARLRELGLYASLLGLCVDVANGYSESFATFIRTLRGKYPDATIMAGNVVTNDMTYQLIESGADIVKAGIGGGSVCLTRRQTGVGYPQLSAVIECADAAHGLGGLLCSDGGCTSPGDVAKAFGGGADFVMLGGMLAGHEESSGQRVEIEGEVFVEFYGMSSETAMKKHAGGVANYRSSEGKRVVIPYRGQVQDTLNDIMGGVRSTCTYIGARTLKDLSKCTTFIRVTQQINEVYGRADYGKDDQAKRHR